MNPVKFYSFMKFTVPVIVLLGVLLLVQTIPYTITYGQQADEDDEKIDESPDTSEPTVLSGALLNDPLAQDILKKIELTKQWIAELQQREYEKLEAQRQLEEKRSIALQRLEIDLEKWNEVWEYYSSRNAFERFVDKKPPAVQGIFWDQFEFKEMKVNAGKDALKQVMNAGGTLKQAIQAYHKAAETKRIELIEQNNKFNIEHNLAYYQQQILFDAGGKFIRTAEARDKLNEFFSDYKTSEAYLKANPQDRVAADYIPEEPKSQQEKTDQTAKDKAVNEEIDRINLQIFQLNEQYEITQLELKGKYDKYYNEAEIKAKQDEREIAASYAKNSTMTKEEVSKKILAVRNFIKLEKERLIEEKLQALEDMGLELEKKMEEIQSKYNDSLDIKILWNADSSTYYAVRP